MSQIHQAPRGVGDTNDWWINISRRHARMGTARLKCICNHLDRFIWICRVMDITFYFPTARRGKCQGPVVQSIVRLTVLFKRQLVFSIFRLQYIIILLLLLLLLLIIINIIIIIIRMFVSHRSFLKSFFKS